MAMNLDELRKEIDEIDVQLVTLITRRMEVVDAVAEIKKSEGLTVFHPEREKEVIERASGMVPTQFNYYVMSLYKHILDLSKLRQREVIASASKSKNRFSVILDQPVHELRSPRVTVQGVNGSFASSAGLSMYPTGKMSYVDSWEQVLYAVEDGTCDYGVLPVENSSAGSVNEVYDLLIKYKHFIVKALPLTVDQCLLGIRGAKISDIKNVYSHPMAFPQCNDFLRKHHKMQCFPNVNTAMAAEFVAREGKKEYAAIASKDCAHIYGLDILAENIQQSNSNTTRFISVSKRPEIPDNANKISLFFTLPHVTGSLYRTLLRFALNGLNLTKIESLPNPQKNFEYYFYLDFKGSVKNEKTLDLLTALNEELPTFNFLGNYFEP
jgi:chorismate mutase/prephenate dehydratase